MMVIGVIVVVMAVLVVVLNVDHSHNRVEPGPGSSNWYEIPEISLCVTYPHLSPLLIRGCLVSVLLLPAYVDNALLLLGVLGGVLSKIKAGPAEKKEVSFMRPCACLPYSFGTILRDACL